jgi:pimeloyl-ACP methyl ester carboxylesterase
MTKRARIVLPIALAAGLAFGTWHLLPRLASLAFIIRVAKHEGVLARLARLATKSVQEGPIIAITTRHGLVETRLYRSDRPARRTTILVPGVHMDGIHEERLVGLARELAATGLQVLTVAPPDLARYRLTTDSTDELEDAIAWAAARADLAPDGRVGIMAFSFSGGLALVAAGRPAVRDRVAFALSFGGHADLLRVLRYLCQGSTDPVDEQARALVEGGQYIHIPKPHDYGAVVALLNLADRMVPAGQAAGLEDAIMVFLQASSIDRLDPAKAAAVFTRARQLGEALSEPARTLMGYVNQRDVEKLGHALTPLLADLDLSAGLSPERSPLATAPVFLLHGADDSVVPASEMLSLARKLQNTTRVRAFASRLVTHAEANRGTALAEMWSLSGFWQDLLAR